MKKTLIALAVAGIAAAPIAAQADAVLYGKVSVDYISQDIGGTSTGGLQDDDVIIGLKASNELDNGMTVSGEIQMDSTEDITNPNAAYIAVAGDFGKVWGGTFTDPLNAVDSPDFSDSLNKTYISDEIGGSTSQAIAYTSPNMGGVDFYIGGGSVRTTTGDPAVAAEGLDGSDNGFEAVSYGVNASFGAVSAHVGAGLLKAADNNDTDILGFKLKYAGDNFGVQVYRVSSENDDKTSEIDSTGIYADYTMGMTTLAAFYVNDDYNAGTNGEEDIVAVKVSHNLGGGAAIYGEYADRDADTAARDGDSITIGMSYSF